MAAFSPPSACTSLLRARTSRKSSPHCELPPSSSLVVLFRERTMVGQASCFVVVHETNHQGRGPKYWLISISGHTRCHTLRSSRCFCSLSGTLRILRLRNDKSGPVGAGHMRKSSSAGCIPLTLPSGHMNYMGRMAPTLATCAQCNS
jgi:hypothetical protein